MTDAPPSRYRIIERDRRLIVIDQWGRDAPRGGDPVRPASSTGPARPAGPAGPTGNVLKLAPRRTGFDGRAELVTHPFYDSKAPRTLRLDPDTARLVGRIRLTSMAAAFIFVVAAVWMPWLLLPPAVFLVNPKARAGLRRATTAWIDRLEARLG